MTRFHWLRIGVGLVLTLVAGFVLGVWLGPALDKGNSMDAVLVAQKEVHARTVIAKPEEFFSLKCIERDLVPDGAVRDMSYLRDKIVAHDMNAGDICREKIFVSTVGLRSQLAEGERAATVRLVPDGALFDFIKPGTRVDVVQRTRLSDGQLRSQVVAKNVRVVQVGAEPSSSEAPPRESYIMPLALTPEQAERVLLAGKQGPLHLAPARQTKDSSPPP